MYELEFYKDHLYISHHIRIAKISCLIIDLKRCTKLLIILKGGHPWKKSQPFKLIQRKFQRKNYVVSFDLHNVEKMHWTYKNQLGMRFCNQFFRAILIKSVPSKLLKIFFDLLHHGNFNCFQIFHSEILILWIIRSVI